MQKRESARWSLGAQAQAQVSGASERGTSVVCPLASAVLCCDCDCDCECECLGRGSLDSLTRSSLFAQRAVAF